MLITDGSPESSVITHKYLPTVQPGGGYVPEYVFQRQIYAHFAAHLVQKCVG